MMQLNSARISRFAPKTETRSTTLRSWDDLNYDVLLDIIKRVPWYYRLYVVCLASKSWLSAVLDSLSNPGVINLKILDNPELEQHLHNRYFRFLKHMLDSKPADSWSSLILGDNLLLSHQYAYIAKRTLSLRQLVIPCSVGKEYAFIQAAFRHWKKLRRVQCPVWLIKLYPRNFRRVKSLRLFGVVDDDAAIAVRDKCPQLKQLRLISCALSVNALSIILDGHKELELLDTRHSFCVSNCMKIGLCGVVVSQSLEWNEDEILRQKGSGIKVHLRCDQRRCARCAVPEKCCFPERRLLPEGKGIKRRRYHSI
ncbi:unnamed protein product [Cuscuta campestris]|uniref:F-box domain-containing protein n=1 Tax=Cuscuta campestris TaxID=132261 RepID=A0A484L8R7_9ASTE|nr:unnamed protein product [Cuscuta campestris]